jgi:hypothetical protein
MEGVAERLDGVGRDALAARHRVSARDPLLRTTGYYLRLA